MGNYIVLFLIVGGFLYYFVYGYLQNKLLTKKFTNGNYVDWNDLANDFESLKYVRRYWDLKNSVEKPAYGIDDTTWNDLDMNHLYLRINCCQCSIGSEYLYAKLRETSFDTVKLTLFSSLMDIMDKNINTRVKALRSIYKLGKDVHNNVHSYIYEIDDKPLKNMMLYYSLVGFLLASIVSCFFSSYGIALVVVSFIINIYVYTKNKYLLESNLCSFNYISRAVFCAKELSRLDFGETDYGTRLESAYKPLKKLGRLAGSIAQKANNDLDFISQYIKIIFMSDFISYNKMIKVISNHSSDFHRIYELIGEIDCAIAVAEYRKIIPFYCKPDFSDTKNILCENIYHPMLKKPVSNSIDWNNNALITGSNASGKSTFVKALAISMICSQSIHICFAKKYSAQMSFVFTSMAVRDSLLDGESYFIAETKSLKRILDAVNDNTRIVCFIDEILKGTNTIERISSSASVLNWLNEKNCLVMAASHDIELTEILEGKYVNYHFEEQVSDDGIFFDYKLYDGIANTRNAIKLLKFMGYDSRITDLANNMAENFERNKKWDNLFDL